MIGIILLVAAALLGITIVTTLVGLSLHDIRIINRQHAIAKHPYAKKWRTRPFVSILVDGKPTVACLEGIRKNNYRKKEIISHSSRTPKGECIIHITGDTILDKTAILDAVFEYNDRQDLHQIEIRRSLSKPMHLQQLLKNYHLIAASVFQKSRSGLATSSYKTLNNTYETLSVLMRILTPTAVTYTLYLAFWLHQSYLLLIILAVFGAFIMFAIWTDEQLLLRQKLSYALLLPVSLGFFVALSWITMGKILLHLYRQISSVYNTHRTSRV